MSQKVEWISEKVAAELMGYAAKTLRRYVRTGKLKIHYTKVNYQTVEYNKLDIDAHKMAMSSFAK